MSEKYETENENKTEEYLEKNENEPEEYLEYPENREENNDFEFLKELTSTHYVEKKELNEKEIRQQQRDETRQLERFLRDQQKEEKRQIRMNKEEDMRQKKELKNRNKIQPVKIQENKEVDSLFDDIPTELFGRDKILVMKQINQYKILFPKELSKFKLKKKATLEELKKSLEECRALIEINSVDVFVLDSILSCCKMIENYTVESDYDITGLSLLLKSNPQFVSLSKQLFIRYNIFSNVPIEYQMMMCIVSTSYLCMMKNKGKSSINSYLNEPL